MWEVIFPLFFLALIAYGFIRLLSIIIPKERKERKRARQRKRKADSQDDAAFFDIIRPIWKNPK
jgi:hypothetical protein